MLAQGVGGTLLGLARLLLGTTNLLVIDDLAMAGEANRVDLSLAGVVSGPIGSLPEEPGYATATGSLLLGQAAAG